MHRVMHHSENNPIKYHEQKLCIKFAFQGSIEQDHLSKRENSVFGVSIKSSIPLLNFSTESAKKYFMTYCYSLQFILLTMTMSIPFKWEIGTTTVTFCNRTFSRLGTLFDDISRILTYCQISLNIFLLTKCPMKIRQSSKFAYPQHE